MAKKHKNQSDAVKKIFSKKDGSGRIFCKKTTHTGEWASHLEEYVQQVWRGLSRKR